MKQGKKLFAAALILCLTVSLCACAQDPVPTTPGSTAPTQTTSPSTEPSTAPSTASTETTNPPTESVSDASALYSTAWNSICNLTDLVMEYSYQEDRAVGSESFQEKRMGTASYAGLNSDAMEALIEESFTCGGYSTQYFESYLSGNGWCRVNNSNFRQEMSSSAFLARQIPAVLTTLELYANIIAEKAEDGYVLYFRNAYAMESWVTGAADATLIAAEGKLLLDETGKLMGSSYSAEFTRSGTAYTLEVSVTITQTENADFSTRQPVYPENTPVIDDLEIPKYLLRTVGHVYGAENMFVYYIDSLSGEAFAQRRTQTNQYSTYGSGDAFMAEITSQVSLTDSAGNTTTNSQIRTFREGLYSYRINNGESVTDPTVTADQIRISLEDSILSSLMMPSHIAGAQILDLGDTLTIYFTGSEAFADSLCASIYSLFNMDLDTLATSYSTQYIQGYLTLDKSSGLPVAIGMSLARSHTINNVSYQLTYQLDQALSFSAAAAYESITGEKLATE